MRPPFPNQRGQENKPGNRAKKTSNMTSRVAAADSVVLPLFRLEESKELHSSLTNATIFKLGFAAPTTTTSTSSTPVDNVLLVLNAQGQGPSVLVHPVTMEVTMMLPDVSFGDRTRQQHVQLIDNVHLIAIGSPSGAIAGLNLYNHERRTVLTKPLIPIRSGVASVATRSKVFLLGGVGVTTNGQPIAAVQVFHHNTMRWTTARPLSAARTHSVAVNIPRRDKIYLIGGNLARTEIVSMSSDSDLRGPRLGPSLCVPRIHHAAVAVSDQVILIFGGVASSSLDGDGYGRSVGGGGDRPITEVEAWHIESNTIVVVGHWANARSYASAVYMDQHVFLVGQGSNCIEKIWVDIDRLNNIERYLDDLPALTIPPPAPIAPSAPTDEDELVSHHYATTELEPLGAVAKLTLGVPSFHPPSRPSVRFSTSLLDRISALDEYVKSLETLQCEHAVVEECLQRIDAHYDVAVKRLEDERQFHKAEAEWGVKVWNAENQLLVKNARRQKVQLETFFHTTTQKRMLLQTLPDEPDHQDSSESENDNVPNQLRCPITLGLMTDPVAAADGNTYERQALMDWFQTQNPGKAATSPLTGAALSSRDIYPIHWLRDLCKQYGQHAAIAEK
jgi:hypothetical protein